jgi:hypothetical protein
MRNELLVGLVCVIAVVFSVNTGVSAQVDAACNQNRYLLHMSRSANGVADDAVALINGTPWKVYEGEPLEWSHYVVTRFACDEDVRDLAIDTRGNAVAGVFHASPEEESEADLVPDSCADPVFLLLVNTIIDTDRYATYISTVRKSSTVARHGRERLFGSAPDILLTGEWPDNTTAWLSRWPCLEAFDAMYTSDLLQKDILPMRSNAAHYRLMAFQPAEAR